MHFVFAAHGTWGDVGPMADVAGVLQRAGARSTFVSTPFFEAGLRARGLPVVTVGPHWDPREGLTDARLTHPFTGPLDIWRLVFAPLVPLMFDAVSAAVGEGPAVVVLHPWCLGAQLAAERHGQPWAVVALSPVTWFSVVDPPVAGPVVPPRWLQGALLRGVHAVLRRVFGGTLHAEAKRRGLQARDERFFFAMREAALNLAFWPRALRAAAADDPPRVVQCGFPSAARWDEALEPDLEAFLAEGPPPLVMGLGSALPSLAGALYEQVDAAARELGLRTVLVGAAPRERDARSLRLAHVPYGPLFSRARVVVHHGGIGTTADALAAGRPQLVIPFGADQHDNGALLVRMGVATSLARSRVTSQRVREALTGLLTRDGAPAQAAAATVRLARPGVEVAAEALQQLARGAS